MAPVITPRKPHRKTRTGCVQCKQRKVKCDEQKPTCSNCVRRSTTCVYVPVRTAGLSSLVSRIAPASFPESPPGSTPESHGDPPPATRHLAVNYSESNAGGLNMLDLELLHNWSTSTCFTLSHNPILRTVWRIDAPKMALHSELVMRAILALSSLHLAHFRRESREFYLAHARNQHEIGLRAATDLLANFADDNCTQLYLFSALSTIFAMGVPRERGEFLLMGKDRMAEWLTLLRGTRTIINRSIQTLLTGDFAPFFRLGFRRTELREQKHEEHESLRDLRHVISGFNQDERQLEIYSTAIDELSKSFAVVFNTAPQDFESSDVFIWLWLCPDEYFELLKERMPEALAIFAHYCVILSRLENWWWLQGSAMHSIATVYRSLDHNHRQWIRWPIEELGWVPD